MDQSQIQPTATAQEILSAVSDMPQRQAAQLSNAPLFKRGIAHGIDLLILSPFYVFFFFLLTTTPVPNAERQLVSFFVSITTVILVLMGLGYFVYFEGREGSTFGKRVMKIRVVGIDGDEAGMKRAIIRGILRPVDMLIWPLVFSNEKRQRLGDIFAHTWVVKME